jgi:hypothetical protein
MLSLVVHLARAALHGLAENVLRICQEDVPDTICNVGWSMSRTSSIVSTLLETISITMLTFSLNSRIIIKQSVHRLLLLVLSRFKVTSDPNLEKFKLFVLMLDAARPSTRSFSSFTYSGPTASVVYTEPSPFMSDCCRELGYLFHITTPFDTPALL